MEPDDKGGIDRDAILRKACEVAAVAADAVMGQQALSMMATMASVHMPLINRDLETKSTRAAYELVCFVRDNPSAPPEAMHIRGMALNPDHDVPAFADMPPEFRAGLAVYVQTFHTVFGLLTAEAEAAEQARQAALVQAAQAARVVTAEDLEGTPLEPADSPLDVSDYGKQLMAREAVAAVAAIPATAVTADMIQLDVGAEQAALDAAADADEPPADDAPSAPGDEPVADAAPARKGKKGGDA
jgi:hypothetical protein